MSPRYVRVFAYCRECDMVVERVYAGKTVERRGWAAGSHGGNCFGTMTPTVQGSWRRSHGATRVNIVEIKPAVSTAGRGLKPIRHHVKLSDHARALLALFRSTGHSGR